tara:strand:- start:393 stop:1637 length:1245 start_codon:yes stop_codon:yes gene_type:complete
MNKNEAQIAVVGAGMSGLIAALDLERLGYSPQLIEASDQIGGRLKTVVENDICYDQGFQVLLTAYPEVKRYLDIEALDLMSFRPGALLFEDSTCPIQIGDINRDFKFLWSTLLTSVATLKDKRTLRKEQLRLKEENEDTIFDRTAHTTTRVYLREKGYSARFRNAFFKPFYAGIYLEPDLITSCKLFEFVFKMFAEGDAAIPRKGIAEIPKQIASRFEHTSIRLNKRVSRIAQDPKTNSAVLLVNGKKERFDAVIYTAAPEQVDLKWNSCWNFYFELEEVKKKFNDIISLVASRDSLINNFYILPQKTAKGKFILSVTVLGNPKDQEQLIKNLQLEFGALCDIELGACLKSFYIENALPTYKKMRSLPRPEHVQPNANRGIFHAGDYMLYPSLNAAMKSGRLAAEAADRYLALL